MPWACCKSCAPSAAADKTRTGLVHTLCWHEPGPLPSLSTKLSTQPLNCCIGLLTEQTTTTAVPPHPRLAATSKDTSLVEGDACLSCVVAHLPILLVTAPQLGRVRVQRRVHVGVAQQRLDGH